MNYEELQTKIAEILPPGFQLLQGSTGKLSLKIDGAWLCFEESSDVILWAIAHPEEHRSREDSEIEEMLADLSAEYVEG